MKGTATQLAAADVAQIVRLYTEEGRTLNSLAAEFSCHSNKIRDVLVGAGVNIRTVAQVALAPLDPRDAARAVELYDAGLAIDDIARVIHRGSKRVKQAIAKVRKLRSRGETRRMDKRVQPVGTRQRTELERSQDQPTKRSGLREMALAALRRGVDVEPNPYWFKRGDHDPMRYLERDAYMRLLEPPPLLTRDGRRIDA